MIQAFVLTGRLGLSGERGTKKEITLYVDFFFLFQMQTHVNVKKLVPPSFYDVAVMTEGVPSVQEESAV